MPIISYRLGTNRQKYYSEVLADAPSAYWRLGEATGATTAVDVTGAYNGTYVGGPTLGVAGAIPGNTAMGQNGGNKRMDGPAGFGGYTTESFSIEFWINGTNYGSASSASSCIPFSRSSFYVLLYTNGQIDFFSTRGITTSSPLGSFATGAWNHIVVTRSGTSLLIYVNGALTNSGGTNHASFFASTGSFSVGSFAPAPWSPLAATIDEVAIYPTALPPARIAAHYNAAR